MHRTFVSSTNLKSVGYDPETHTLEVEFHDGAVYQYFRVPQHVYMSLMNASSKGGYLDDHIKKGQYRYRKIR
jgi:hypothetical protein